MSFRARLAIFAGTGVALFLLVRYHTPDAVAARADASAATLCRTRYASARTAADTTSLDPLRTLTGDGEAEHTCGELRLAGRTN